MNDCIDCEGGICQDCLEGVCPTVDGMPGDWEDDEDLDMYEHMFD